MRNIESSRARAGATGVRKLTPQWSHYVMKLRCSGLVIDTIDEKHVGPFSGRHGRYVLRSTVTILPAPEQEIRNV